MLRENSFSNSGFRSRGRKSYVQRHCGGREHIHRGTEESVTVVE